jgi:hypothetical protein
LPVSIAQHTDTTLASSDVSDHVKCTDPSCNPNPPRPRRWHYDSDLSDTA